MIFLSAVEVIPVETAVQDKWLPVESVRVIPLPAESLGRKKITRAVLAGSHFSRTAVSADAIDRRPPWQKAKVGGLVYTLSKYLLP